MTPCARSLELLRRLGFLPAVVERWIPRVNVRSDLWHFGDILAVHSRDRIMLIVQATSLPNVAARLAKAKSRPELAAWLRAGGRFEVHGWTCKARRWHCKRVAIKPEDLATVVISPPPRRLRPRKGETQASLFSNL